MAPLTGLQQVLETAGWVGVVMVPAVISAAMGSGFVAVPVVGVGV